MIPLTEWSRRRPPPPVFSVFEVEDPASQEIDESGVIEFDGLLGELIENLQVSARAETHATLEAHCAAAKQSVVADIEARIAALAERMTSDLTGHFNAVLKPWMGQQIEQNAIEAFCTAVSQAVGDELSQEIAIQAPVALHEKIMGRLEAESIRAELTDSPDAELHSRVGATSISTEISVWQARLNSVLP